MQTSCDIQIKMVLTEAIIQFQKIRLWNERTEMHKRRSNARTNVIFFGYIISKKKSERPLIEVK